MDRNFAAIIFALACAPTSFALAQASASPPRGAAAAPAPASAAPRGTPPKPAPTAPVHGPGEPPCEHDCPMMQHGHGDHDMGGHAMLGGSEHDDDKAAAMIEHLMEKLGVSEPVHKKIDDLLYEAKKRAIALRADAERAHLELEHSLSQDAPDTDAVLKQMDKVGQARTELMKVWMKVRLEGAKLLTPDQRAQLKHLMHDGPHGEGPEHGHDHEHDH